MNATSSTWTQANERCEHGVRIIDGCLDGCKAPAIEVDALTRTAATVGLEIGSRQWRHAIRVEGRLVQTTASRSAAERYARENGLTLIPVDRRES